MNKPKKLLSIAFFTLLGAGYFTTFSNLEVDFFIKNYLILVPIQLTALIYWFGWQRTSAKPEIEKN
ncbi:hypothetical protein ACKFKF_27690 [Phormidesmis sp. 146-12]